jgi:V/A-type H+-transporting ATPase subunit I
MIAQMDRVEVVCLRESLTEISTFIQSQGVMHMEEVPLVLEEDPDFLHRNHLNDEQREEFELLDAFRRNIAEIRPLLNASPSNSAITVATQKLTTQGQDAWRSLARTISRNMRRLARQRINIQDNLEVLNNFKQNLESISPLIQKKDVRLGKDARAFVIKGDVARALERLKEVLQERIGADATLISRTMGRSAAVGVITHPEAKSDAVAEVMREQHIAPVDVPDQALGDLSISQLVAKVSQNVQSQETNLAGVQSEIDAYSEEIAADVLALERIVNDRVSQYTVCGNFANSELLGVIHGWIPNDAVASFTAELEEKFPGKIAVDLLPTDDVEPNRIPTMLKNHSWFKPFEVLLMLFKPPTYGTYDPTALVAVSFIMFYGFILGDAAYGLIIMGAGFWIKRKWDHINIVRSIGVIAMWMGLSSIVWGIIYGEYFGDFGEINLGLPYLFHRAHEPDTLLLYGIMFGVVHIPLSLILGIREKLAHGHKHHAYEQLGMLMGLTGIGIAVFGGYADWPVFNTTPMLVLAGILFIGGAGLLLGLMGAMGLIQILEIISLVGNVMSYARLMALGVASIALADIANGAARDLPIYMGIPIALLVHVANIGIGVFSPTLHSLRLNYVEFLPKFYSPEGNGYKPFKKEAVW